MKKSIFSANTLGNLDKTKAAQEPVRAKKRVGISTTRKGKISCTYLVDPDLYRKLQEIKIERRTSLQGLLDEAVDTWLASIGETGIRK